MLNVKVKRLPHAADLPLPAYQTQGAAGMDVLAAIVGDIVLPAGGRMAVPTGLVMEIPPGHEMQVRARSGLALRDGIAVLNAPGTIDSDYRGEVQVILANLGTDDFTITPAMRIAQLVLAPVVRCNWVEADDLSDSARGAGGFGSTGRS